MIKPVRHFLLVAGAAALCSTQAFAAAPSLGTVDPLVSVSVFGTAQSRSAVCAAGTVAAAAGASTLAGSAAATQGAAPGCVLPVTAPAAPAAVGQTYVPASLPGAGIGLWALLPGLLGIIAIAVLLDSEDNDRLRPISPF